MKYQVKDPSGKLHVIEGPEGASPDEVIAQAQKIIPFEKPKEKFIEPAVAKEAAKFVGKSVLKTQGNILKDAAGVALGGLEQVKQGLYDIPKAVAKLPAELSKTIVNNTKPDLSLSKFTREQTGGMAQGIKKAVENPLETVIEHPIGTALAFEGAKAIGKGLVDFSSLSKTIEKMGARKVNEDIGLNTKTLDSMMQKGETPGNAGLRIAKTLVDDKIIAATPDETYLNAKSKIKSLGEEVGALKQKVGKDSFVENTQVVLEPIRKMIEKANAASTSEARSLGKTPNEIYDALIKDSKKYGNKLTLEAIDKKLNEVGDLLSRGSLEKRANNKVLYGKLANIRDQIVTETAKGIGDPKLRQQYLETNKKYSFYKRLEPVITKEAEADALGKGSKFNFLDSIQNFIAKLASKHLVKNSNTLAKPSRMPGFPIGLQNNNTSELEKLRNKLRA